jgi:hypothetical protein
VRRSAAASLVLLVCLGWLAAAGVPGISSSTCSAAQKAQRARAAAAYAKQLPAKRAAYFRTHRRADQRTAFVKRERATLARLRRLAACVVPPPVSATTTTATTTTALPPVATQETFVFDAQMPAAAQDEIRGDVQFAAQDEARLLGIEITTVSVFASTSPDWLADHECRFNGHNDDGCLQSVRQRWASGSTTAVGGTGAIFLYWASPGWGFGAGENQKIIAHELFHVFQYQLDKLVNNGATPSNQVRASGPVWLDEGAPELVGYHVSSDRGLTTYGTVLANQIVRTKQISAALSSLQTYDDQNIPGVYSLFHVAADHLVTITPAGLAALSTYYNAIGNGVAWPDAFAGAFGMTVDAYYSNFAAYRAKL